MGTGAAGAVAAWVIGATEAIGATKATGATRATSVKYNIEKTTH